jgi:hypothetical protein
MHPYDIGLEVGALAPDSVTIDPWKDPPEALTTATNDVRQFLQGHAQPAS